jgi:hypothetical protein
MTHGFVSVQESLRLMFHFSFPVLDDANMAYVPTFELLLTPALLRHSGYCSFSPTL